MRASRGTVRISPNDDGGAGERLTHHDAGPQAGRRSLEGKTDIDTVGYTLVQLPRPSLGGAFINTARSQAPLTGPLTAP